MSDLKALVASLADIGITLDPAKLRDALTAAYPVDPASKPEPAPAPQPAPAPAGTVPTPAPIPTPAPVTPKPGPIWPSPVGGGSTPVWGGTTTPTPAPAPKPPVWGGIGGATPVVLKPKTPPVGNSWKKGMSQWDFGGNHTGTAGASWYYNWSPFEKGGPAEFIPMIWGHRDNTDQAWKALHASTAPAMLGCNEPDGGGQGHSNVGVDDAVWLWNKMVEVGGPKRMGSPAVASDYNWLAQWWSKVQRKPDFIAVHTYPNISDPDAAVRSVVDLLTRLHQQYGLPVWLTETGAASWSGGNRWNNVPYAQKLVAALEKLDFCERYAWFFETGNYSGGESSGIWNGDGSLTDLGKAYRDAK